MTLRAFPVGWKCAGFFGLALASVAVFQVAQVARVGQAAPRGDEPKSAEDKFHPRLLEIAKTYESFGRVDDDARWAPYYCRMPNPAKARFSGSRQTETHGQKLYSLFVSDRAVYQAISSKALLPKDAQAREVKQVKKDQPVGQVLVKQSWIPREVSIKGNPLKPVVRRIKETVSVKGSDVKRTVVRYDSFLPYAQKDGKLYHADKQADLFIMYKLDPATPGTDKGWVYGTVTPDGKKVTSAGRVGSCMKCHEQAKGDRLFGLPVN